jgi:GNAT superfamily N-acetyltransferase
MLSFKQSVPIRTSLFFRESEIIFGNRSSMEYGGIIAFVDDLFVQRPFRRAGLGAAALAEVRDFCASRGVRAIFVETGQDNVAAQAVYRRAGFVNTDRQLLMLKLAEPTHVN